MHRFLLSALALSLAMPALPMSLDETLNKMDTAAKAFKSMTANIKRVSHTAVINESETNMGTVVVKRPKPNDLRMLTQLTTPDPKSVSMQGSKLEVYYPKMKTVEEYDLGKNRGMVEQFFLLGFGTPKSELQKDYDIKVLGDVNLDGKPATHLELTPKSEKTRQQLKKAELWIGDGGYPLQQKFYQSGGDYHLVSYSSLQMNPSISDSKLKLNLPSGVQRTHPGK